MSLHTWSLNAICKFFPKSTFFTEKRSSPPFAAANPLKAEPPAAPAAQGQAGVRLKVLAGGVIGKKLQKNKKRG